MLIRDLRHLRLGWRKFKRTIEWLIYWVFDTCVLASQKVQPNASTIAVVHIELLGDYALWWPYGRALIRHAQAQGKHVTLVVNHAVLPLVRRHFPNCHAIGIDRARFVRSLRTRVKLLRQLQALGTRITYHDTHPRDAIIEDATVRALGAPAWGFDATFADRPWFDRWLSRRLYAHLLPPLEGLHQGRRHHALLQAIGVPEAYLQIHYDFASGLDSPDSHPYFVIAPGSSQNSRRWPVYHFADIALRVLAHCPTWHCVILGTEVERPLGDMMVQAVGGSTDNRAGKTNLLDLVRWISHARLVIGNDSAACHVAAACGVANVAVVGGGHHGRCFPYDPTETCVRQTPVTISEPMACFGCEWICQYPTAKQQPFPCIAAITPDQVWPEVQKALPHSKTGVRYLRCATPHPAYRLLNGIQLR